MQLVVVPRLETERLLLEPFSVEHSEGMFSLWSNPEVCRYSGPINDYEMNPVTSPAESVEDSDKILEFWLKAREEGWGFRWALVLRHSKEFIGIAGFNSLGRCSEYAYHLHPNHWGKGLMTEASKMALQWISGQDCVEVEAFIDPENARSIALAERLGFRITGDFSEGARRYLKIA